MSLNDKLNAGILALGLLVASDSYADEKESDTKIEYIQCSNRIFACKPADCKKYCRETFSGENKVLSSKVSPDNTCECRYTPKEITVTRKCENWVDECSMDDCNKQCTKYVERKDGNLKDVNLTKQGENGKVVTACVCTYKPR